MQDFEKLGAFYLGKLYDMETQERRDELLLYDSKDLTTHAVCVGMTGSGKTGLCLSLLEEAAIDGVPAIAIDPKGDLGNLFLTFPELKPADFRPWIEESAAVRAGETPDEFAASTAKLWREGLASWGQEPERIARFREAVDMAIYTPGSSAGIPLTVLKSFAAPSEAVLNDTDALRERVMSAASGLLGLLGIDADPVRSREHILVSNLFDHSWRQGKSLDVTKLIQLIQAPPMQQVGVIDLDTFFPPDDRMELSLRLNNLLASPTFAGWLQGDALDIKRLLYTESGKPRLSVISIAHLSDAERMFFVTILLNEIVAWMRGQSGTTSLRAILYMDEVFGYFPPTANPPSKVPMLTLLKQARAYGLGVVLATQNPVDLDYKGLSNTGTWFLGRLQTERDKLRVLEGLEGASAQAGSTFDRQKMEATLAGLGSRVFLMNNVHEDEPVVFQTRGALSYLRGPLTRSQIQTLMAERQQQSDAGGQDQKAVAASAPPPDLAAEPSPSERPVLPPEIEQQFLECNGRISDRDRIVYRPALFGRAALHFVRQTYKTDTWQDRSLLSAVDEHNADSPWDDAVQVFHKALEFDREPQSGGQFSPVPPGISRNGIYDDLERSLKNHLYRSVTLAVWKCLELKAYSQPGEGEDDFRIRLAQEAREHRDLQVEKLGNRYAKKMATIQRKKETAEKRLDREKSQYYRAAFDSAISFGSTLLGSLFGRKLASRTNVSRASTSMRSAGRAAQQRGDVKQAEDTIESLDEEIAALEQELKAETEKIEQAFLPDALELEELSVRPRKSDIRTEEIKLVWLPWRVTPEGISEPVYELESIEPAGSSK